MGTTTTKTGAAATPPSPGAAAAASIYGEGGAGTAAAAAAAPPCPTSGGTRKEGKSKPASSASTPVASSITNPTSPATTANASTSATVPPQTPQLPQPTPVALGDAVATAAGSSLASPPLASLSVSGYGFLGQGGGGIPVECASMPFKPFRSTGINYVSASEYTVAVEAANGDVDAAQAALATALASRKSFASTTYTRGCGDGGDNSNGGDVAHTAPLERLPYGMAYYKALREAWRQPGRLTITTAANNRNHATAKDAGEEEYGEEEQDDDAILYSIEEMTGPSMHPPVPLSRMIELLVPQWRTEGLYTAVERAERHSQSQAVAKRVIGIH